MVVAATNNNTATGTTASSTTTLSGNFETFLKLLTTQLQSQDPLSPMDTKDFTNQLVQFSSVEQQMKTNSLLTSLTQNMSYNSGSLAVSYLGKTATAQTNLAGIENGQASWTYELPSNAKTVALNIYDSNNRLVKSMAGATTQGSHTLNWDGTNSNGVKLTSGTYSLKIEAVNDADKKITAVQTQSGIITNVDMSGAEPTVRMGGADVPLSSITKVSITNS